MILILGGTTEARALAQALADRGLSSMVSLAGVTDAPRPYPIPTRIGGFGGAEGFRAEVARLGVTRVIDATHPFASRITTRSAALCVDMGLPFLCLQRTGWAAGHGDRWTWVNTPAEAIAVIPPDAVVFLATGAQSLDDFAGLRAARVLVRVVDVPPAPLVNCTYIVARGPFDRGTDRAMLVKQGVTWVIARDAGGTGARAKLDAARDLGLPVVMIRRPPVPDAPSVSTVAEALEWLDRS